MVHSKRAKLIAQHNNPELNKYAKLKLIAGILVVIAFIYLAWYSYSTQISNINETDLPIITSPTTPIKVKPDDPGGLKIEHKDKEIYDHINGKKLNVNERIVRNNDQPATHEKIKQILSKQITQPTKLKINVKEDSSPEKVEKEITDDKKEPVETIQTPPPAKKKTYSLRIAALKSAEVMDQAWQIMKNKYQELKQLKPKLVTSKKNDKIVYFLHAEVIESKEEADKLCSAIIKAGGKCKVF
jgi:hypothetical protein